MGRENVVTQTRQLAGKIAVVTGAGDGIGRAAAIAYDQDGAGVAARFMTGQTQMVNGGRVFY